MLFLFMSGESIMRALFILCLAVTICQSTTALRADDIVRVGLLQMDGREFDKGYNLARAEFLMRKAAARGAQILCAPEVAVQGYPRVRLQPEMSLDDPAIVALRQKILAAAETIPGPATTRFSTLARELRVWIIVGMDENRNGKLFNTAVLINPAGEIAGKYSKVHLQNWMMASGVNHGDGFPVWEIEIDGVATTVGIQICYDIQHPESTRELALGGAEIVFVPYCTRDFSRPLLVHLFQTRALENRVFLARVNFASPRNAGTSSIIDYEGSTMDELDQAENVLVGDLNLTALRKVRSAFDEVYGPKYRRPSAYQRLGRSDALQQP
jgi:predicted amidohydrolase